MKVVNIANIKSVGQAYYTIPQPMFVYHTNEEFAIHVMSKYDDPSKFVMINDFGEYCKFLADKQVNTDYDASTQWINVSKYNVWIRTVDKYIPDYTELSGKTHYILKDGELQPTDGCWVELFAITPTATRHILHTSSGIHTVGMTKWDLTGGVRSQFRNERDNRVGAGKEVTYQNALEKLVKKKKPDASFMKLAMAIFLPDSETFLKPEKSVKSVFKGRIRAGDREKIIHSEAFRRAVMEVLKIIQPDLKDKIKEEINPGTMSVWLKDMWQLAKDNKSVDDMMKVFNRTAEIGYTEQEAVTENPQHQLPALPALGALPSVVEIKEGDPQKKEEPPELTEEAHDELKQEFSIPNITTEAPLPTVAEMEGFDLNPVEKTDAE